MIDALRCLYRQTRITPSPGHADVTWVLVLILLF
jgi:hypothetical protein